MDEDDHESLRWAVRRHREETDSAVANKLLDRWRQQVRHFLKVTPTDYKRVLEAAQIAEEKSIPVDGRSWRPAGAKRRRSPRSK